MYARFSLTPVFSCSVCVLQSGVGGARRSELGGSETSPIVADGAGMSRLLRQSEQLCRRRCRPDSTAFDLLATLLRRRLARS